MSTLVKEEIDIMKIFGQFLKHKRKEKGLTQEQVAEMIGMSGQTGRGYISNLERNKLNGMNLSTMGMILSNLGCSILFIDREQN